MTSRLRLPMGFRQSCPLRAEAALAGGFPWQQLRGGRGQQQAWHGGARCMQLQRCHAGCAYLGCRASAPRCNGFRVLCRLWDTGRAPQDVLGFTFPKPRVGSGAQGICGR